MDEVSEEGLLRKNLTEAPILLGSVKVVLGRRALDGRREGCENPAAVEPPGIPAPPRRASERTGSRHGHVLYGQSRKRLACR